MTQFNKYAFLEDVKTDLQTEIKNGNADNAADLYTLIHEYIDNACIYYSDCFDICKTLCATDFTAYDIECNTIDALAYAALSQYVFEELDINELEESINELQNA